MLHIYVALLCLLCSSAFAGCTKTPIKHLVVIVQENRTFDHYFATYPHAENLPGEKHFHAKKNTPSVNGLNTPLLTINKNLFQPFRLSPEDAATVTCDPDHSYTFLQVAMDMGLVDKFVQAEVDADCAATPWVTMGYFDGNTVYALWTYAQNFAMSDNFHATSFGPSTIGALNLISGQTHGVILTPSTPSNPNVVDDTMINNVEPTYDMCSKPNKQTASMSGINIGNRLNDKGITWGWFTDGFEDCMRTHIGGAGTPVKDYKPIHSPFMYYQSTANPLHLPPSSSCNVGKTDQANHNYDLAEFWKAAKCGKIPAVSFFKAAAYQDGHAKNSSPLLEQDFLIETINRLQKLPQWESMAIIITYDDPGGWYDHEMPPIVNQSQIPQDALTGPGSAGTEEPLGGYQGRPGYGQRLPFILISPYAKKNYVDSSLIDQTSILRFIEENWDLEPIGDFSYDAYSGSITNMFDFEHGPRKTKVIL